MSYGGINSERRGRPYHRHILVQQGIAAPVAFEPDVEATTSWLEGGGDGGHAGGYLCHGGITRDESRLGAYEARPACEVSVS